MELLRFILDNLMGNDVPVVFVPREAAQNFRQQGRRECDDGGVPLRYVAGRHATENEAWERVRLGAPGLGG